VDVPCAHLLCCVIVPGGTLRRLDGQVGDTLPQNFSAEHSLYRSFPPGIPNLCPIFGIAKDYFKIKIFSRFFKRIVSQRKAGEMTSA
jgi:hypothetical protein